MVMQAGKYLIPESRAPKTFGNFYGLTIKAIIMVKWKQNIQLLDLDTETNLEVTCKTCGFFRYVNVGKLLSLSENQYKFLDEIEQNLTCKKWGCDGKTRIAIANDTETEGFTGGLS